MKNKFLFLVIVFFGFFFFSCFNVNADTVDYQLNFDMHDHFNYFYEMKENSPFYQFVISKGDSLSSYLSSYGMSLNNIWFSYASDIDLGNVSIPQNSYYVIMDISSDMQFYYLDNSFHFSYSVCRSFSGCNYTTTLLFYDSNMNFIEKVISNDSNIYPFLNNFDKFQYVFGMSYGRTFAWCTDSYYGCPGGSRVNVRVTSVKINNIEYNLKNLETRSGWSNFWSNFNNILTNSGNMYDLNNFGLGFLLKNYVITSNSSMVSLYTAFNYSDSINISVPDGYSSQSFSYDNRYYLIPNNLSCSVSDSLLYFSSSDISSINFINYSYLNDTIDFNNFTTYSFQLKKASSIEALSLLSIISPDSSITDNIYLINSSDNFGSNIFYYNSNCFSSYAAISSSNIEFTNINTGNSIIMTPGEQQLAIYNLNSKINSIIDESNVSNNIDITSIISSAWDGAKTFINASYYILSMVSNLFSVLPNEVKGLLLCVFSLGMVIILWKVFRS